MLSLHTGRKSTMTEILREALPSWGSSVVISAYSRQTRSAMGGELDHKEREVTSHGGDFRWSSEKSGTH